MGHSPLVDLIRSVQETERRKAEAKYRMKALAEYSAAEQSALRAEVCRDAPDEKINYYLRVCEANQVDPFSGLLYLAKRTSQGKDRWSVSPTVDGSRLKASRTGQYAGSDEPEFDAEDKPEPVWCKVTVWREIKGERYGFTAKCRMKEFMPPPPNNFMWKAKPYHMLSKITEVQALRKGFPDAVPASGEDEDDTVVGDVPAAEAPAQDPRILVQWKNAVQAFQPHGKTEADLLKYCRISAPAQLVQEHLDNLKILFDEIERESEIPLPNESPA